MDDLQCQNPDGHWSVPGWSVDDQVVCLTGQWVRRPMVKEGSGGWEGVGDNGCTDRPSPQLPTRALHSVTETVLYSI